MIDRYYYMTKKTKIILWVTAGVISAALLGLVAFLLIEYSPRFSSPQNDSPLNESPARNAFKEGEKLETSGKPEQALVKYKAAKEEFERANDTDGVADSLLKIQIAESMIHTNELQSSRTKSSDPNITVESQKND